MLLFFLSSALDLFLCCLFFLFPFFRLSLSTSLFFLPSPEPDSRSSTYVSLWSAGLLRARRARPALRVPLRRRLADGDDAGLSELQVLRRVRGFDAHGDARGLSECVF